MGIIFINYFCMKKMDEKWRQKYINSIFLIAPSIGGSFLSFSVLLTKKIPFLSFLGELTNSTQKLEGVDVHIPNAAVFGDQPLFTDKNGYGYTARYLKETLKKERVFDNDPLIEKTPPFDLPTTIVHTNGLKTLAVMTNIAMVMAICW